MEALPFCKAIIFQWKIQVDGGEIDKRSAAIGSQRMCFELLLISWTGLFEQNAVAVPAGRHPSVLLSFVVAFWTVALNRKRLIDSGLLCRGNNKYIQLSQFQIDSGKNVRILSSSDQSPFNFDVKRKFSSRFLTVHHLVPRQCRHCRSIPSCSERCIVGKVPDNL
eukprot:scaffold896_cov172-Amphora_coffeaeformis.AAC.9